MAEMDQQIDSYIKDERLILTACEQKTVPIRYLIEMFGNMRDLHRDTILGALKNVELLSRYRRAKFTKYHLLQRAIADKTGGVLVFFPDLQLYAIAEQLETLENFISNIADSIEENGISVNMNQIVLGHEKQKLVFMVRDKTPEVVAKVCESIRDQLKLVAKPTVVGAETQIRVDGQIMNDHNHVNDIYTHFLDYMCKFNPGIANDMRLPLPLSCDSGKYWSHCINDALTKIGWSEHLVTPANVIIINNNVGTTNIIANNVTVNNFNAPDAKNNMRRVMKQWVKNNSPDGKTSSSEYYEKYKKENVEHLSIQQFSKEMTGYGFSQVRKSTTRCWANK